MVKKSVVHEFAATGASTVSPKHSHFIGNHHFAGLERCWADILTTMFISGGQKSQWKLDLSLVKNDFFPQMHNMAVRNEMSVHVFSLLRRCRGVGTRGVPAHFLYTLSFCPVKILFLLQLIMIFFFLNGIALDTCRMKRK